MSVILDKTHFERMRSVNLSPRSRRLVDLLEKITSSTASEKEKSEFREMTKRVRELDPNVLVD